MFLCNFSEATAAMDALMKIETNALHTKKLAFLGRDMLVRLLCIRYTFFDEIFYIFFLYGLKISDPLINRLKRLDPTKYSLFVKI